LIWSTALEKEREWEGAEMWIYILGGWSGLVSAVLVLIENHHIWCCTVYFWNDDILPCVDPLNLVSILPMLNRPCDEDHKDHASVEAHGERVESVSMHASQVDRRTVR